MVRKLNLLISKKYGLIGFGLGIFFWVFDSAVDAFIFHENTFLGQIFVVDTAGAWMRLVIMSITTIFGFWAQGAIDRHRRIEDALRKSMANDITERRQSEALIHHLAYYDLLTDLPNRLSLHDDIDRTITRARMDNMPFALIVINLDRFEEMNNTLGHNNGDLILQGIAVRLKGIFLQPHTVARLGGDEFAVLIQGADTDTARIGAERIIEEIKRPFPVGDLLVEVSSSIGIALFPGHGEDVHTLIRRGEMAMYAAKRTESGSCVYSKEYDQYSPARLALMGELRHAIEQDQLFLLYQPKIDLKTGKTIGVEALVRWQHPRSGVIPPNDFIHLAERGGLIKELTLWVLKEALSKSRGWLKSGIEVSVAINLSVKSLHSHQLLDQIKKHLLIRGITPGAIRFEITESIIMSDPRLAMEIITDLTSMGIRFSIDDFGTGYSSLGYLQKLPVDEIKIDKSFVMNMMKDDNSLKIVRSIIELGHSLGLKVVAEGVEDKKTYDKLVLLDCDLAQGYYMSRPVPLSEFIERMTNEGSRKKYPVAAMS